VGRQKSELIVPVPSEKAQEELQALYRAYVENLPQKVDEVEHLWSRAVAQTSIDLVVLNEMHLAAHSLSGSGATYGCVAISEAFARLEDRLQTILDHQRPTPKDRKTVTGLLAELKALALAEQDHLDTAQADTRPRPPHKDRPAHASGATRPIVLVVDDTESVRRRLRVGLEDDGFHVVEAANGQQAWEQARLHKPVLILLDIRMPEVDGFEALRLIRAEADLQDTPIFFLSSARSVNMMEIQTALSYGIDGYLSKTLPLAQIVEKVRSTLAPAQSNAVP